MCHMEKLIIPKTLYIEASTCCQLRCPICPTTDKNINVYSVVGNGYLEFQNLKNLLENNPQIKNVHLENRGEMFLNPELLDIIKYAREKGITVNCISGVNLNDVREDVLLGLVRYKFQKLLCSIDGASDKTYRTYRIGGNFERVLDNIKVINYYKKKWNSLFPKLIWQFVVFGHNERELPLAKKMAKELNMSFNVKISWDSTISPIRNKEFVVAHTGWPAVTREDYYNIVGIDYMRRVCYQLWHSPHINWDGKVLGCCWNSWSEFGGNVFKEGYVPSLNSEEISYARNMLLGGVKHKYGLPCSECALYLKMKEANSYLKIGEIFSANRIWYRAAGLIYRNLRHSKAKVFLLKRFPYVFHV